MSTKCLARITAAEGARRTCSTWNDREGVRRVLVQSLTEVPLTDEASRTRARARDAFTTIAGRCRIRALSGSRCWKQGGRRSSESQRECVQYCKSSQYHLLRLRWTAATLEKLKPRSKHLSSRRRRCHLPFDFVEHCTGGFQIGLCRRHTGHCAFVRLKRRCYGGLSGGKSLASFAGHKMLSPLLPRIRRNRFDSLPCGNCTA